MKATWVIVTGAAGAIGKLVAERYAASGRFVLALDQRPVESFAQTQTDTLSIRSVDLSDAEAFSAVLNEVVPSSDPIALLINAAGLIWNEPVFSFKGTKLLPHESDSFDRVVEANLKTTFIASSRVATRMARTGGGAIINFSSASAVGNTGQAAYSAAKAAIEGLTRSMSQELGPLGVRVNAISPGFIDLPSTRDALCEQVLTDYAKRTPLRRLGTIEDLLLGIEALERNTFISGTVLHVDGGLRL